VDGKKKDGYSWSGNPNNPSNWKRKSRSEKKRKEAKLEDESALLILKKSSNAGREGLKRSNKKRAKNRFCRKAVICPKRRGFPGNPSKKGGGGGRKREESIPARAMEERKQGLKRQKEKKSALPSKEKNSVEKKIRGTEKRRGEEL